MSAAPKIDLLSGYQPKTPYYAVQRAALEFVLERPYAGVFLPPRRGKTKVAIDKCAFWYQNGRRIDAILVLAAPNGVHRNFVTDEVPAHLPDSIPRRCLVWRSGKHKTAAYAREMNLLLGFRGMAVLAVNAEALSTSPCRNYIKQFLSSRKVGLIADETSFWMRKAGTARTRVAKTISRHPSVVFRLILDGTPTGEKPLDLYSQIMFLSEKVFGFTSRFAFDSYYAEWEEKVNHGTGQAYRTVKQYRNLDVMRKRLDTCCFQATRQECSDFPPKVYQRVYFQLSEEQRRVYDDLREEYEAELAGGDRVTATHVLTRYLRLQQVGSNYWPSRSAAVICNDCSGNGCHICDDIGVVIKEIPEREIGPSNPRLVALHNELVKPDTGPFIVWARFIHDVDKVFSLGRELGFNPVRYDGEVPDRERATGLANFQAGRSYMLVGNQGAGGRGLRMDKARTMIYYSNDFSRLTREHSEERAEAAGGSAATSVLDLIAEDTVDIHIVEAHRSKMALSELIYSTKDRVPGKWLK